MVALLVVVLSTVVVSIMFILCMFVTTSCGVTVDYDKLHYFDD